MLSKDTCPYYSPLEYKKSDTFLEFIGNVGKYSSVS
jgi:hypothetical protein